MEDKVIDLHQTVYEIGTAHPEIIDMMISLGFEDLGNPAMFQTAARFVTIPEGARRHGIDLGQVEQKIKDLGFELKEA